MLSTLGLRSFFQKIKQNWISNSPFEGQKENTKTADLLTNHNYETLKKRIPPQHWTVPKSSDFVTLNNDVRVKLPIAIGLHVKQVKIAAGIAVS